MRGPERLGEERAEHRQRQRQRGVVTDQPGQLREAFLAESRDASRVILVGQVPFRGHLPGEPADQRLVSGQTLGSLTGQDRIDLFRGQAGPQRGRLVRQALEVAAQHARDGQDGELALPRGQRGAEPDLRADLLHRVADLRGQQHDRERPEQARRLVHDRHGARLARPRAAGDRLVERALRVVEVRRGDQVQPGRPVLERGCLAHQAIVFRSAPTPVTSTVTTSPDFR